MFYGAVHRPLSMEKMDFELMSNMLLLCERKVRRYMVLEY